MGIEINNTPDKYKKYEKYTTWITPFKTIKLCKTVMIITIITGIVATMINLNGIFNLMYDSYYDLGDRIWWGLLHIWMGIGIGVATIECTQTIVRTMYNIGVEELIQKDIAAGILIRTEDGQLILTEDLYKNDDK